MNGAVSPDQLLAIVSAGESKLVEFKRSAMDTNGLCRTVCGLSNDLAGTGRTGTILVGLNDDGCCADLSITDELLRRLAGMKDSGYIQPLPSLTVAKHAIPGCEVAAVRVEPSRHPPVRFRGRVWVRVGPSNRQATADEELRLAERNLTYHRPFDLRPAPDSRWSDLDLDYARTQYVPSAVAEEVLERNQRPLTQQLRSLRLATGEHATWGGILAVGVDPQAWLPGAYVQFLRIDGPEITDPIRDQKRLSGRLGDVLLALDTILRLNLSVLTDVAGSSLEVRQPDYPVTALEQLARNAVMHRSYEGTNAPVRIYWYSDRIEIMNPGSLYGKINPDTFGTGETDYRNPLVAEIMRHLGFAQRFGLGLPLARRALSENGNPAPEFRFSPTSVLVTLRPAR